MSQPEIVRRIKSFSSETGYVFQYQFHGMKPARRGFSSGTEYTYLVWAQSHSGFAMKVFVKKDALRALTGTEEYAIAKMRLFQALDEFEGLARGDTSNVPDLVVDETNLAGLLERLDL